MSSHSSSASSAGSVSGFPEEDLRSGGRDNPGYFPARLGQTLQQGRYCIVRKLGWGQYSSVWLAKDRGEDSFVALKILTCEATRAMSSGPDQRSDELHLLEKIASARPTHRGFQHTLKFHESFEFNGPHGQHCCLVTEVLGYSMNYIRKLRDDNDRRVAPSIVKKVVKQALLGLEYLHDECGIVHGDLKHDNILFRPRDVQSIIAHELVSSPSVTYDCGTEVSLPVVPIVSQGLPLSPDPSIHERLLDAVLADVGHSHWKDHHFQEIIQPDALRAPEVILGYPWSTPADIWNLGYHRVADRFLALRTQPEKLWSYEEDHLARMTEALEESFTPSFLDRCANRDKFFKTDGTFAQFTGHKEPTWPLRKLLEQFSELPEADIQPAEQFLRRCMRLTPEERATAKELVDDPWLADSA